MNLTKDTRAPRGTKERGHGVESVVFNNNATPTIVYFSVI